VDFEGAVRAGKTTPAILKVIDSCQSYPGIQWLIARWTQDTTDAQLKARFRELCSPDILVGWNAQEQYFEIATEAGPTSRIYARGWATDSLATRARPQAGWLGERRPPWFAKGLAPSPWTFRIDGCSFNS
jgi:hypothetical protein